MHVWRIDKRRKSGSLSTKACKTQRRTDARALNTQNCEKCLI